MIIIYGKVSKVTPTGECLILVPNGTSFSDTLQVVSDKLKVGQDVEIKISPLKVRACGAGVASLTPSMAQ